MPSPLWPVADANLLEFFSAVAQIFGALLGLLSLVYERIADSVEQNFREMMQSVARELNKVLTRIEQREGREIDVHVESLTNLRQFIESHKDEFEPSRYASLLRSLSDLEHEQDRRQRMGRHFRRACVACLVMILAGLIGLVLPAGSVLQAFFGLVSFGTVVGLVLVVRFYMSLTQSHTVLMFHD